MLKSIREEPVVTEALQKGRNTYPRVWEAFESLCWILTHREIYGATIPAGGNVYRLHKQGPGGYGVPALTVIYTVSEEVIVLHALKVG